MVKIKTTKKELNKNAYNAFAVGYCGLQNLLSFEEPFAYTTGTYGWNCDVYLIDGIIITTGYRGMVGYSIPYDDVAEIEKRAEKVLSDSNTLLIEKAEKLHEMAVDFFHAQLRKAHETK